MGHITAIIIGLMPSVLSGCILLLVRRQQKKADRREQDQEEREELTLEALNAIFSMTKELTACVLFKKEPDGELEEAYNYQRKIKHDLEGYERRRAARK